MTEEEKKAAAEAEAKKKAEEAEAAKKKEDEKSKSNKSTEKDMVKKMIEKARKEEKEKLYPKIDKLEGELKTKDEALKNLSAEMEKTKQQLEEAQNKGLSDQDLLKKRVEDMQKQMALQTEVLNKERETAKEERRRLALESYKERKLREVGNQVITEMVGGNSEQEIDAAIEKAKARYNEVYTQAAEDAKNKIKATPTPTPVSPSPSSAQNMGDLTQEQIKNMSVDDWRKVRDKVLAQIGK